MTENPVAAPNANLIAMLNVVFTAPCVATSSFSLIIKATRSSDLHNRPSPVFKMYAPVYLSFNT